METGCEIEHIEQGAVILNSAPQLSRVDADQLRAWMKDGDVFLVDVREPGSYENSRIAGAFLVPISRFDVASFPRIANLKTVLVCQNGFLSPVVRDDLINAGFESVYALDGGVGAWVAAGYDVDE